MLVICRFSLKLTTNIVQVPEPKDNIFSIKYNYLARTPQPLYIHVYPLEVEEKTSEETP